MTLAGFAGVVVVFRKESVHDWSAIDKFRLRLLLANSLLPTADCLAAMLLLSINPPPLWIWRGASGFALACLFPVMAMMGRPAAGRSRVKITGRNRLVYYPFFLLGSVVILLQVYNIAMLNVFWAFYAVIILHLFGATVQFARIILLPPEGET